MEEARWHAQAKFANEPKEIFWVLLASFSYYRTPFPPEDCLKIVITCPSLAQVIDVFVTVCACLYHLRRRKISPVTSWHLKQDENRKVLFLFHQRLPRAWYELEYYIAGLLSPDQFMLW